MSDRQFPNKLHPLPALIAGHEVMAAFRVPPRDGEIPNQAVFIGRTPDRPEDRAFVVWDAAVRGGEWVAYTGFYDASWPEAVKEFTRRCLDRV